MNTIDDDKFMNNHTIKNAITTFNDNKLKSISSNNQK